MTFLIFLLGLLIGSFLNVCIYRIPAGQSIVSPPSSCGACSHRLNFWDMLPVINYITNRGKCRYCKASYSVQYPLIELMNGMLYVLTFYYYGLTLRFALYAIIISVLIVISMIDLKTQTIPDELNLFAFAVTILFGAFLFKGNYLSHFYGFLFGFILFLLIAVLTNAMGGGDIKLMGVLGLLFGLRGILFVTVFSFVYGALISIMLMIAKKAGRKDYIPFGPFISLSALTYILFGNAILTFYFQLILS